MKENAVLNNGIRVTKVRDDKFQSVFASFKIAFKLKKYQNTCANVLAQMMSDRLEKNPSKDEIAKRLDLLYGTKIGSTTYSMGSYQIIDLSVQAIAEHFVDMDLFQEQLNLLADMLYEPLLSEASFTEAVKNSRLNFNRIKENPSQYALLEAFKESGKGQTFELTAMGNVDDLDTITLDDVKSLHQECVNGFYKELFVVGPYAKDADYSRFEQGESKPIHDALLKTVIDDKTKEVMHPGNQTELVLVYETAITPLSPNYASYLVFIAHLGQLPSSLLFQTVREQHSLCYSIYASRQIMDGIFYIATGVNDRNVEKTLNLIEAQIDIMKNEVQDVSAAKHYLSMQMEGVKENQRAYVSHIFRNSMLDLDEDVNDIQNAIEAVTSESVMEIAKQVKRGFIYAYRGEAHEED